MLVRLVRSGRLYSVGSGSSSSRSISQSFSSNSSSSSDDSEDVAISAVDRVGAPADDGGRGLREFHVSGNECEFLLRC